jgi:FdhD protein
MTLRECPGIRVEVGQATAVQDAVVVEEPIALYLNDEFVTELVASPTNLEDLGVGFVVDEGLAEDIQSVRSSSGVVRVYARSVRRHPWRIESSGGLGTHNTPPRVSSTVTLTAEDVLSVIRETTSELWRQTGAVHCSVLLMDHELVVKRDDIGRHNTIDKVVGFAIMNQIDLSRCIIGCTGRQPAGMVSKVANAGVPVIVSKAAPTYNGILTANDAGITLICFARGNRFTIYTHPQRIRSLSGEAAIGPLTCASS